LTDNVFFGFDSQIYDYFLDKVKATLRLAPMKLGLGLDFIQKKSFNCPSKPKKTNVKTKATSSTGSITSVDCKEQPA